MNRLQLLMAMAVAGTSAMYAQDRPNVIFFIADDLGYGDLQCYGAKNVETPNANRMAEEGIRFTQCHASAATSTPSRYSILTGEYAWRKPGTDVLQGNAGLIISDDQYTVADMFHDNGYATAAIGKWHLGLGKSAGEQNWNGTLDLTPSHIGFDYHYIQAATADRVPCVYLEQDTVANYDPSAPIQVSYSQNFEGEPTGVSHRNELKLDWTHGHNNSIVDGISRIGFMKGGGKALWKDENIADSIAAHSRRFIMEHKDEPFFMYLCTNDVHVPRWPHDRFRGKNVMGLRGDAIASFDWTLGEVLQALEDAGVADNTLLIITSDNGPVLDDGYADEAFERLNGHTPTAGRRGDKYSNFEGGTMVPFIVHWPKRVKPQAEGNNTLLSLIDLFGSMSSLIGAELPAGAAHDSGDMLAQILGESNEHRPWVSELGQTHAISVRTDRWKYIPAGSSNGALGWAATGHDGNVIDNGNRTVDQLYDMLNDPNETTNVAEQYPDVLEQMIEVWKDAADINFEEPLMSTDTETHWYTISTPMRENLYVSSTSRGLYGVGAGEAPFARSHWKFERREDGMVNIINRESGKYINPGSATTTSTQFTLSANEPARGWMFDYAATSGYVVIYSLNPTVQLNQTTSANSYKIVNWGGARHDDTGCQFLCTEVTADPAVEVPLPTTFCEPTTLGTVDDPVYYVFRSSRYAGYVTETANGLYLVETSNLLPDMAWNFVAREDGDVDIINLQTGRYILPETAANSKQLITGEESPENGWTLSRVRKNVYTITSGTVQMNQTTSANNYKLFNYGGGSETADTGCQFRFINVTETVLAMNDIDDITVAPVKAPGQLYDLYGRKASASPRHGVYIRDGKKIIL